MSASYLRWGAFVLVAGLVMYGIFRPIPPEMLFEQSDKVGHIGAFLVLALTGRMAMNRLSAVSFWLMMLILAVFLEYLQGEFRPFRVFSLADVVANGSGVLLALCVYTIRGRLRAA